MDTFNHLKEQIPATVRNLKEKSDSRQMVFHTNQRNSWIIYCIFQPVDLIHILVSDISSK